MHLVIEVKDGISSIKLDGYEFKTVSEFILERSTRNGVELTLKMDILNMDSRN